MHIEPELIRLKDAADLLNISLRALQRSIAIGRIPAPIRLGPQTLRYSKRALLSWIAKEAAK